MLKRWAYVGMIGAALAAYVALAQSQGGSDQPGAAPKPSADDKSPPSAGDVFVKKQTVAQWRAPKLVGVNVFDADNKKIGKIDDILISHDGAAEVVVVGFGGFLGLGTKEVAVPFAAMRWRTETRVVPITNPPVANPLGSTGDTNERPRQKTTDPAAAEASQGYPDMAFLGVTLAQLQSAPDFEYAPSPLAALDMSPSQSGAVAPREPKP